jgi:hypothetical protein
MIKLLMLQCFFVFVVGCAPTVQLVSDYKVGKNLNSGERSIASVGDVIYSEYEYTSGQAARILGPVTKKYGLVTHNVQPGTVLISYLVNGKKKYCTKEKTVMDPIVGPWNISCFSDKDGDGSFESVSVNVGDSDTEISPTGYKVSEISLDQAGFKYELIYQGRSENVVNIAYREYKDSLARPAFQQDLKYTLMPPHDTEISFMGVRIVIHEATNNRIDYTLASGFNQ